MQHKLFLGAAALFCFVFTAQAQDGVIYSQDFEGDSAEIFAEGWDFIGFEGPINGNGIFNASTSIQALGFEGKVMGASSFTMTGQVPTHIPNVDSAIISPIMDIAEGATTLSFRIGSVAISANAASHYSVYALTTDELETAASADEIKALLDAAEPLDTANLNGQSHEVTIDISEFAGEGIVLFFRLHETPANAFLLFDDVTVITSLLGTDEHNLAHFILYPNPVQDVLNINPNANVLLDSIAVYNTSGQLVAGKKFSGEVVNYSIAMGDAAVGVYIVKMISQSGTTTKRIVKN